MPIFKPIDQEDSEKIYKYSFFDTQSRKTYLCYGNETMTNQNTKRNRGP